MHGQYRKLVPEKVLVLKRQGLSNAQIAQRMGVTQGAVCYVLRKSDAVPSAKMTIVLNP